MPPQPAQASGHVVSQICTRQQARSQVVLESVSSASVSCLQGMSLTEFLGLMIAAAAGGAINAVAGGGTLVTFPALLFFGTPPVIANATSTLALVIGTSGSIYGYRKHLAP